MSFRRYQRPPEPELIDPARVYWDKRRRRWRSVHELVAVLEASDALSHEIKPYRCLRCGDEQRIVRQWIGKGLSPFIRWVHALDGLPLPPDKEPS